MAVLLAVAVIAGAGMVVTANAPIYEGKQATTTSESTQTSEYSLATTTTSIQPDRLIIPKIDVDAAVEEVGINERGNMGVPKDWRNVSWYEPGYLPGEAGNAVLAGHLDWDGSQAVFWDLEKLESGDLVQVTDDNGDKLSYVVTSTEVYGYQSQATDSVFGSQGRSQLKLITCDGNYLDGEDTYQDRYIVTARLITPNNGEELSTSTSRVEVLQ